MPLPENRLLSCTQRCELSTTTRVGYPCTDACQLAFPPKAPTAEQIAESSRLERAADRGFGSQLHEQVEQLVRDGRMRYAERDPVKVLKLAQAVCDRCGWHSPMIESQGGGTATATEWARVHRISCPVLPRA